MQADIVSGYDDLAQKVSTWTARPEEQAKKQLPVYDGTCPAVTVRPDLRTLVEYQNETKPSPDTKLSEVTILGVENTCRVEDNTLVMQLDIALSGQTGPKARTRSGDQPNFAYPYFVAVTDTNGAILSKEIFAASLSYGREKTQISQTETLFQNMPIPPSGTGRAYTVVIGFQLTPAQLAYNTQKMPR